MSLSRTEGAVSLLTAPFQCQGTEHNKFVAFGRKTNHYYIQLLNFVMQVIASASASTMRQPFQSSIGRGLQQFLGKRIFPGFRVGEMLIWFLFHVSWPLMLVVIYNLTGRFNDPDFMTLSRFASVQAFVVSGKALFLMPFWWLYFVRLKKVRLSKKIALHFVTSPIYIALCICFLYVALIHILHVPYPRNSRLADIYNLMIVYTSHFALFHAYNFWLHTKEQMKKEQALKELAYQTEIKALKSQIEPHFLFNTLNSISASVPPSLEKTRVLIAQLADTFRYALRVNENQVVSLGDELAFMKTWLSLEKQRFGERLTVHYQIDPLSLDALVPPMILQPLVENALNHGIAPKVEGGTVTIQCSKQDDMICIAVCDTGVGYHGDLQQILHKSVGLSNISKRLKLLYNESLEVARCEQGLCFSFQIPFTQIHETKSTHY